MNNLDSCEKSAFFCACFECALPVPQMKRAKILTRGVSHWQTSVKILWSSGSFLSIGGLLTLQEETGLSVVRTLSNSCGRKEEQSYLRKRFLIDLHRFRCFQNSLSSILRQPKILRLTANGVCLGECLKYSIWEIWCCGLGFYPLPQELSLPRVMADAAAKSALAAGRGVLWAPSQLQEEMPVLCSLVGPQTSA